MLPAGLYRVENHYLCAGFIIEAGKVTHCAPILCRKLDYWMTQAKPVTDAADVTARNAPHLRSQPQGKTIPTRLGLEII